tara:strand:- start:102 stop:596 length:495 start_codon:yes stop_codon:yes gene_type:complete
MSADDNQNLQARLPGLDRGYDFVLPSYDWALRRFEAIDGRLQGVLSFMATVTLAGPVIGKALSAKADASSPWFIAALSVFAVSAIVGTILRMNGELRIVSLETIHETWVHADEDRFKLDSIHHAGAHLNANLVVIRRKANAAALLTGALAIEIILFSIWMMFDL